ncbi:hypothetical protein SKAU_G00116070 [Synaphobranchus kaupii]|uniref:Fibrinogen C-terminal domain-containing protein n=1 Tax=Synaphobranchus kaupii TaxID=118154 RepID=A0A9Q1FN33_SYNKA|nr:hypothetical protein SKAU_G00116070 [Synaphobranchus kaupii]
MVSVFLLVLLPVAALSVPVAQSSHPDDCEALYRSGYKHRGVYSIYPTVYNNSVQVFCDMDYKDNTGWTVIQRRLDGTVNFHRPWGHYKSGFGNIAGEHWLGLQTIFAITGPKNYRLRVDMEDFEGGSVHAEYTSFYIEPESDGYRLRLGNYIDGGAGDSLTYQSGRKFSTFDNDQDNFDTNCAVTYHGGFWFNGCFQANPNGLYTWGPTPEAIGVIWKTWKGFNYSLKSITMKIRPRLHRSATPLPESNVTTSYH